MLQPVSGQSLAGSYRAVVEIFLPSAVQRQNHVTLALGSKTQRRKVLAKALGQNISANIRAVAMTLDTWPF
jgi:hypothetical protein